MSRDRGIRETVTPRDVLIPLGVGVVLGFVVFWKQGGLTAVDMETFWRALCDATAVPGLLLTCAGFLSVVSGQGAFDGLNFATRKAFGQILSEERRKAMPRTFYDYVTLKQQKQRKRPRTVLWIGLGYLGMSAVFLVLYFAC